jgi:peptide chain release factor 3
VVDLQRRVAILYDRVAGGTSVLHETELPLDDPSLEARIGSSELAQLHEEIELLEMAGDRWSVEAFLAGEVSPVFFGSAMTNFGVQPLLEALCALAPAPGPRPTTEGSRAPTDPEFSGFVFKIQANMNPRHRDRIAFVRVVSGPFERGMDVTLARTGKTLRLANPHTFMASERSIVEEAVPGDIVGLYDPGEFRLGDTISAGPPVRFLGSPRFAPEHFARVRLLDPTRRKHLTKGLTQLAHEGAIQRFIDPDLGEADPYLGAVGLLQFEVLTVRLKNEYGVEVALQPTNYRVARWVAGEPKGLEWLQKRRDYKLVADRDGRPVVLAEREWPLQYAIQQNPGLELLEVSPLERVE